MQVNILSFNQSELCVELRQHPNSKLSSNELELPKVSVRWSHDDRFTLQVTCQSLFRSRPTIPLTFR